MMRGFFILLAVTAVFFGTHAYAGEYDTKSDVRISPGMKVIKAGDANVLVPKGGMPYRDNQGRIYEESPDAYAARGFIETDKRIKGTETDLTELEERVRTLEDKLEEMSGKLEELEKDRLEKER